MRYDIYITRREDLYEAAVPALPGCATLGRSESEVLSNIRDVIESHLRKLRNRQRHSPEVKIVKIHHGRIPESQSA